MPYIITTKRSASQGFYHATGLTSETLRRRAVATIEEASDWISERYPMRDPALEEYQTAVDSIPEEGGTVRLPGGIVVEVESTDDVALAVALGRESIAMQESPEQTAELCAAYNRAQGDDGMTRHYEQTRTVSITQRDRGVYLCHTMESEHGVEDWEAFSTLAKAKRWCAAQFEARPKWEETREPNHWPRWWAEEAFDGAEVYVDDEATA